MVQQVAAEVLPRQRTGVIACSRLNDVLRMSVAYYHQIVAVRHGHAQRRGTSGNTPATEWGIRHESQAVAVWSAQHEMDTGKTPKIISPGLTYHPECEYLCGVPDRLVNHDGMIEVKCPYDQTEHLRYITLGVPEIYRAQLQGYLCIKPEREWIEFVSYDPRLDPPMDLYRQRIKRDEAFIRVLMSAVHRFWKHVIDETPPVTLDHGLPQLF